MRENKNFEEFYKAQHICPDEEFNDMIKVRHTYSIAIFAELLRLKTLIASYYRQLSANIKMKNYKHNFILVGPEGPKALANQTSIDILILLFAETVYNTIRYDT